MSAPHLSDRELLAELLRLANVILARPADAPRRALDLSVIADDLSCAVAVPASRLNAAEAILFAALQQIVGAPGLTQVELYRFAFIAEQALPLVRDHYFEVLRS